MSILQKFYNKIKHLYLHYLCSPEKEARAIGVNLGRNNFINTRHWSSEPYLISIGNDCAITSGVHLHTHGGARVAWHKYPKFDVFGKIKIGNGVYIGTNAQIMPGVTIGDGAMVTAGSIVTHSVPAHSVWGGVPAKFICTVDEYIERNLKYNLDSRGISRKAKRDLLLSLPEDRFIRK